jgi:hypothetical protein
MEVYQGLYGPGVRRLPVAYIGVLTVSAQSWEGAFRHFDQNNNNAIDGDELRLALERFGYRLSPALQNLLKRKYGAGLFFRASNPIRLFCPFVHSCSI